MGDLSKKTLVGVKPDVVYSYVADPRNTPHYISSILSLDGSEHGSPAVGQVWPALANFMGKRRNIDLRIEELQPASASRAGRVRYSINSDPPARLTMTISPNGANSTEAELTIDVPGIPGLILNGVMGGMLSSDMARLKKILEQNEL